MALAKRVICVLTILDGVVFRTRRFRPDLRYTASQIDVTLADELALIDIGTDRRAFFAAADRILADAFVPVTLGGGVHTVADVREMMLAGADKVIVGRALSDAPDEIARMAEKFGAQALVAAVDDHGGKARHSGLPTVDAAVRAQELGCGEILLQSVERDGSLGGYDLTTLRSVCDAVSVPVIVCSGCGAWSHMAAGFVVGASACGTNNIFHYTANSLTKAKAFLAGKGLPVRIP